MHHAAASLQGAAQTVHSQHATSSRAAARPLPPPRTNSGSQKSEAWSLGCGSWAGQRAPRSRVPFSRSPRAGRLTTGEATLDADGGFRLPTELFGAATPSAVSANLAAGRCPVPSTRASPWARAQGVGAAATCARPGTRYPGGRRDLRAFAVPGRDTSDPTLFFNREREFAEMQRSLAAVPTGITVLTGPPNSGISVSCLKLPPCSFCHLRPLGDEANPGSVAAGAPHSPDRPQGP